MVAVALNVTPTVPAIRVSAVYLDLSDAHVSSSQYAGAIKQTSSTGS